MKTIIDGRGRKYVPAWWLYSFILLTGIVIMAVGYKVGDILVIVFGTISIIFSSMSLGSSLDVVE